MLPSSREALGMSFGVPVKNQDEYIDSMHETNKHLSATTDDGLRHQPGARSIRFLILMKSYDQLKSGEHIRTKAASFCRTMHQAQSKDGPYNPNPRPTSKRNWFSVGLPLD